MDNLNFTEEQKKYIEALIVESTTELEKKLRAEQLLVEDQKFQIEYLKQQINYLTHKQYGRRSEQLDKEYPNLFNYDIFNEAEDNASSEEINEPINVETGEPQVVTFEVKGKKKQNLINRLDKLEVKTIIHDIADSEKICGECGTPLVKIGETETFKLKYIPAKLIKERHVYPTYKCENCYKDDVTNIVKATYDLSFPKSMVSSSFVANMITDKFLKYVPLYRQEKLFRNVGLDISRQNLSNWFLVGAKELEPLVKLMHKDILLQDIIHADETILQVIESCKVECRIWGMASNKYAENQIRLYFYKDNRKHDTGIELFKGFKGYIQSDCYQAYDKVPDATDVACIAHARRKYADFIKACKGELKESNSICLQGIKFLDDLYKIEHKLQKKNASIQEIYEVRNKESREILNNYKIWLDKTYPLLPPKGNLAKALYYSINNYDNLCNYLLDGRLAIDNNLAERCMKNFVIGRKNFLFCFTENGADMSAIAYSIVETAVANSLNVFEYLNFVFDTLPKINKNEEDSLRKLLPYSKDLPNYLKITK
ncbi:MAG: IS66 family transposase [Anaeroplasmataceae bacterium]